MIFVDANFLIYLFSKHEDDLKRKEKCVYYLNQLKNNGKQILTSTVVLSEVMVKLSSSEKQFYLDHIKQFGIMIFPYGMKEATIVEFDKDILLSANLNRKKFKIDNMIFATAMAYGCSEIVSNDKDLVVISNRRIRVKLIDEIYPVDENGQGQLNI